MEIHEQMLSLLGLDRPASAREFLAAWQERRNASFADAHRESALRAASSGHQPALRGQQRYHMGEKALRDAATDAGYGHLAMPTISPGATFITARVGRFALVSVNVRTSRAMPRKSATRLDMSRGNLQIERERELFPSTPPQPTVMAYLGCVASVPSRIDPSIPEELAFAIPNKSLTDWICWVPINRAAATLQGFADGDAGPTMGGLIPDNVLVTLRLPSKEQNSEEK